MNYAQYERPGAPIKYGQNLLQKIVFLGMDTRFLETFLMVVENGSIAEAARRLNLTSAAVALRLHALEKDIGAHLLFRSGRTVRPTEAGTAILGRARNFLSDMRDLRSIAASDVPAGEFRLGVIQTALSGLLPEILAVMTEKYPQILIRIIRGGSAELYARVLEGDLDAAIIIQPSFTIPKTCDWRVFRSERLVALIPQSMSVRDPRKILRTEPFIRQDHKSWAGRLIEGYLRQARIQPYERFELDGYESIAIMVDRGLGVSLVHDWAPPWPEGLSLTKIPIGDKKFGRQIGLLWMRASIRVGLVYRFLKEADTVRASRKKELRDDRTRGNSRPSR